jgi:hypothetical protein
MRFLSSSVRVALILSNQLSRGQTNQYPTNPRTVAANLRGAALEFS